MAVLINKKILQDDLYYDNNLLLSYKIEYPQFVSNENINSLYRLNRYYEESALALRQEIYTKYFSQAIEEYIYSVKNNFPIRKHEIFENFEITYNENSIISLYFDLYQYFGGAHGTTIRTSETWDLENLRKIRLYDLFNYPFDYKNFIINMIKQEINLQRRSDDEFLYFGDYNKRLSDKFTDSNFYLVPEGLMFYYQQYDIAPYASGIPEYFINKNDFV